MENTNKVETRHCSGCGQDKPLSQFQVEERNADGTGWTRTRKWCLACCNALFKRQAESDRRFQQVRSAMVAEDEERKSLLGFLPTWCDRNVLDYLVNAGEGYLPRAHHMELLWRAFEKYERETSEPLGGRGGRFIRAMAGILEEPEPKLRQKLKRMSKHADGLSGVFETASGVEPRRRRKLQAVQ